MGDDKGIIGKVILASSLGTVIDYYDLFIVSTAASLVWPSIFFTGLSAALKASLTLITFGITYITRPVGAFIFGHFGDKIGRRDMLVWT
ncbi:MAG: MFS transporter, partial [Metallosphaera sp.]